MKTTRLLFLTALLVPFTSCTARLAVYVMLASTFFPDNAGNVVFAIRARELVSSLSYYQEKLDGQGIGTTLVRTVSEPLDQLAGVLERSGFGKAVPVDPAAALGLGQGVRMDTAMAHRIAPSVGAAAGRAA